MYRKNFISMRFLEGRHKRTISLLRGFVPRSIVDVGCDDGHFLRLLGKRYPGAGITACDIDPEPVKEARKVAPDVDYVVGDFMESALPRADLVVMLEILEHTEDPRPFLRKAASLIGSEGRILVSIPRPELLHWRIIWGIWSNTLGRRWIGQHSALTEKELVGMARECGLEVEKSTRFFFGSISIMLLAKKPAPARAGQPR